MKIFVKQYRSLLHIKEVLINLKMLIRNGLFIASNPELICIISGFNLFKDVMVNKLDDVLFEGAKAMIYTNHMKHVHPFVKSLLNVNFIGDMCVEQTDKNLKEDFIVPIINNLFAVNNIIIQKWDSLHTPKGYVTVSAFNAEEVDLYNMDNKPNIQFPFNVYDIRNRKLYRTSIPKENVFGGG